MGLDVTLGLRFGDESDDNEFVASADQLMIAINSALSAKGLASYDEPKYHGPFNSRCSISGFPYDYLKQLCRFYAHAKDDPKWVPAPLPYVEDIFDDPFYDGMIFGFGSHLVCHSYYEGVYLPLDFRCPMMTNDDRIPGTGIIGSSYGLQRELVFLAPHLGIDLVDGELSDLEADRINEIINVGDIFLAEKIAWFSLFEACRLSIQFSTMIVYR